MSDSNRGIYEKFKVTRTDGSSAPGGKHEHCSYFVLDLAHDKFAGIALAAYAEACADEFPALAADIRQALEYRTPYYRSNELSELIRKNEKPAEG